MERCHRILKILLSLGFFLCLLNSPAFASSKKNNLSFPAQKESDLFVSGSMIYQLSIGTGLSKLDETRDVALATNIINRYSPDKKDKLIVFFGLGFGYQLTAKRPLDMSLGLSVYRIIWGKYGGLVHPAFNLNPSFDTLTYTYHISSYLLWIEQYWIFGPGHWRPYIYLAIGGSWNHTFEYNEVPTNPSGSASPMADPYAAHTHFDFSYAFGIGVNYLLSNNKTQLRLGYRYINLGVGHLGNTPVQTTRQQLSTGSLYAHIIVFSVFLK